MRDRDSLLGPIGSDNGVTIGVTKRQELFVIILGPHCGAQVFALFIRFKLNPLCRQRGAKVTKRHVRVFVGQPLSEHPAAQPAPAPTRIPATSGTADVRASQSIGPESVFTQGPYSWATTARRVCCVSDIRTNPVRSPADSSLSSIRTRWIYAQQIYRRRRRQREPITALQPASARGPFAASESKWGLLAWT